MDEYLTCPTCGCYIDISEYRASCQLCGQDMCVHCMKECQECGKEICRDCYRGKGLCRTCAPLMYAKNSWNNRDCTDNLSQAVSLIKAIGGVALSFHEREKLGKERRTNESRHHNEPILYEYKDAVYKFIEMKGSASVDEICEHFDLLPNEATIIIKQLRSEGKTKAVN